jgi:hypothetical protein
MRRPQRRLVPAVWLLLSVAADGTAWARCNSLSITVEGIVEPHADGALVRVEVEPGTPRESVAVWPDTDGKFSASLWYSTQVGLGLLGNDCSRRPKTVLLSLVAGERTLATARLDVRAEFAVDALGNYRTKSRAVLKADSRPAPQ